MSAAANPVPVISLGEGFDTVVIQCHNIKVEIHGARRRIDHSDGRATAPIEHNTPEPALSEAFRVGAIMPDGTIFAGRSPDSGWPMYVMPSDALTACTFNEAARHARRLDAHGRRDWRVPTRDELNVLFQSQAAIRGFNTPFSGPRGWYWSSSRDVQGYAWAQRFSNGYQLINSIYYPSALRCVRG